GLVGHELVAQALFAAITDAVPSRWPELATAVAAPGLPVVRAAVPAAVSAIAGGSVLLTGDFDGRCTVDRVWVGGRLAPSCRREGPCLRVTLPGVIVPGPQQLELVTGGGTVRVATPLQVLAPELQGDARRRDGEVEVVLQAPLPPRCEVMVLASRFLLSAPR